MKHEPLRMAGATAFFTSFALPAILIILFQTSRLFMGQEIMGPKLQTELAAALGYETVEQILDIVRAIRSIAQNWLIALGGFIFLLFVATTLFNVIRGSINELWCLKSVGKRKLKYNLGTRLRSIVIILAIGVLLITGVALEAIRAYIGGYLASVPDSISVYFRSLLNDVIAFVFTTSWFAILFRYLPMGRPTWRVTLVGSTVTAVLFTIGKLILRTLLNQSNLSNIYGTSASIVLILLFVFYSALILYFGASFTDIYAQHIRKPIQPLPHASYYETVEMIRDEKKGS